MPGEMLDLFFEQSQDLVGEIAHLGLVERPGVLFEQTPLNWFDDESTRNAQRFRHDDRASS